MWSRAGDKVLATDPESGETAAKPVLDTITGKGDKNLVQITIDADDQRPLWTTTQKTGKSGALLQTTKAANSSGVIIATANHPLLGRRQPKHLDRRHRPEAGYVAPHQRRHLRPDHRHQTLVRPPPTRPQPHRRRPPHVLCAGGGHAGTRSQQQPQLRSRGSSWQQAG
ncbi:hypothetical protein ACTIVE_6276 [Actinomadura verrucosospora]|uniref:Uncharacterized protein n=1 Tax=Actinomadura verrucosospora TaxID=46165 RepID=A0A7D4A9C6_ACTVE|nr:hypothetical protein ACTIVE_6276 [Actinomadura verrucosospora]